jgi:hypothetical protein
MGSGRWRVRAAGRGARGVGGWAASLGLPFPARPAGTGAEAVRMPGSRPGGQGKVGTHAWPCITWAGRSLARDGEQPLAYGGSELDGPFDDQPALRAARGVRRRVIVLNKPC